MKKKKDRIFCGHDMGHLLDVARLAWIFNLEANQEISKERIYAAALLHDIGGIFSTKTELRTRSQGFRSQSRS